MSKQYPVVGISSLSMVDPKIRFKNYKKSCVNEDYITSVLKAGGTPFVLPIINDESIIKSQLENIDAIILTGGADINPKRYNEEEQEKLGEVEDERDNYDFALAKIAKELKIPTLCICRGHQVANVFEGGSLYQDLSYYNKEALEHDQYSTPCYKAHDIIISKDSILYDILKKETIKVNSFHHQMIKNVANEFKVTATSPDGVVEALEYKNTDYFFLSIQWHPEMMAACEDEDMIKIFKRLIEETKTSKE